MNLNRQFVKDSYFGEMWAVYDKIEHCYYMDKEIELDSITTPVTLFIVSNDKRSQKVQQVAFESIKKEFPTVWHDILAYLTVESELVTSEQLRTDFRLESLTIPIDINEGNFNWEIGLLSLKDGFSRIIVEMRGYKPFHVSVDA